ncbi:N-acetylmuramoyl-L-alanine amidase, partial [Streptomyces sp. NTH33]
MSYPGLESGPPQPERPRRPRRGPLTVALAALVPGALLGWVVYE